ncbi:MAG TPA: hypothetical protein VGL42_13310 [Opitutaceae bacterium]|jgi:hypothetical protein
MSPFTAFTGLNLFFVTIFPLLLLFLAWHILRIFAKMGRDLRRIADSMDELARRPRPSNESLRP